MFQITSQVSDSRVEVIVREHGKETARYTGTIETAADHETQNHEPLLEKLIKLAKSEAERIADLPAVIRKAD